MACDSRQVYQGLDIGTGKLPGGVLGSKYQVLRVKKQQECWEIDGVKIWMYDVINPRQQYTVFDYINKVRQVIGQIEDRGKLPIIVGGTGLYLRGLLDGFDNLQIPFDPKLRGELSKLSLKELQKKLSTLSPIKWKNLNNSDQNNPRRLVRQIEFLSIKTNVGKNTMAFVNLPANHNVLKIGLTAPRSYLNQKIDQRVLEWVKDGIVDEVKSLLKMGVPAKRFKEIGLEYALVSDYIIGQISDLEQLIQLMQTKVRQYAKRQMTWFKKEKNVNWFDVTDQSWQTKVEKDVLAWYNQRDNEQHKSQD